ncbi:MAG: hypothetical protein J0L64_24935 [Acidobacteria bacterium]|nr:hypothetical protein [Acidobacteriota bacterium]
MIRYTRRGLLASAAGLPLLAQASPAQTTPAQAVPAQPQPAWNTVYHFDEDERQLAFLDLSFYSSRAGMAIAALSDRGNVKPAALRTTDGGATWTLVPLKPRATSIQFLDESNGWLAADNGIYKSTDAGQSWRRVFRNNNLLRVRFATHERGYAAGDGGTVLETQDGGKTWKPLAATSGLKTPKERTVYDWIELPNSTVGFISGNYQPEQRRRRNDLPAWIDPPAAMRRRQTPSLSLVLQTIDGGKLWKPMSSSILGRISRLSIGQRGLGLSLVEFEDSFDYPSEVYLLNLTGGKTDRIYRDAERHITDLLVLPDNTFLLAGYETPGRLRTAPIPGKVHILHGDASGKWTPTPVDYRATARNVRLVPSPSGAVFALTDTGMILRRS